MSNKAAATIVSICAILFVLTVSSLLSRPQPLKLTWENPTTNTNDSPLTDLAGILLCFSESTLATANPKNFATECKATQTIEGNNIEEWNGDIEVTDNMTGSLFVRAAAFDTSGNISDYSNELSIDVDTIKPSPPALTEFLLQIIMKFTITP